GNVVMPVEYTGFDMKEDWLVGRGLLEPLPEIKEAAAGLGYINVLTDQDGITRAANLNVKGDYDHFALAVLEQYMKRPVEKETRYLINFIGRPESYPTYSFSDILKGEHSKEEFKDKIVLIGATAPDLHDDYFVPTSGGKAMPGVEIHANTIQQMITGRDIEVAPDWATMMTIIIVAVGVALTVFYLPIWLSTLLSALIVIVYTFIAIFMFNAGIILNIVYVPATIIATYTLTMIYFYMSEKKSRQKVLGAFEKYVSKDVINHILEHPEKLKLGGEKRTITVFFSDIRGFTTISEKLSPEKLVHLLNEYLSEMTDIILRNNGVVDKYMGDAIMAFWNAPLDQPKHAERACITSLEMENRLKELQQKWKKDGVPHLEIGIGLNTGPAVVGNMGSYERFDYTAMGDTVNLGSRLEGLNKPYGTRIIISETTKKEIEGKPFLVRKLDLVAVKGKKEPIVIYELVSKKEDAEEWYTDVIKHFEKGLEHYFKQKWSDAIKEFQQANKIREGGDPPSMAFIERCEHFRKHTPGKGWDGVWVMKTK
ncbi:CHASE2 domain-containing protein, partial [Candidatus Woesearchaeota archaeon]|nr:CHASE2 domain-containing protein [Candidatus Woesearchaeota archaeon]